VRSSPARRRSPRAVGRLPAGRRPSREGAGGAGRGVPCPRLRSRPIAATAGCGSSPGACSRSCCSGSSCDPRSTWRMAATARISRRACVRRAPACVPDRRHPARHEATAEPARLADARDRDDVRATPGAPYARYATIVRGASSRGGARARDRGAVVGGVHRALGFLLLLFPDGHLPMPRWRWFARICGTGLTILFLLILLSPDQGDDYGLPRSRTRSRSRRSGGTNPR